mgnify:CR=1 FL=1
MEYILTKNNFDEIALGSAEPILVDFWASWCGPCMMLSPIVEELSKTHKVGKVNVDEEPELAAKYGIVSIPTLVVMEGGQILRQVSGARPRHAIEAML